MKEKEETKKWITLILVAVISYWFVNNLSLVMSGVAKIINVFLPFILGIVIAFILNAPMTKIENFINKHIKHKDKFPTRVVSISISLVLFIAVIIFISFLLIPELIENIELLINNIPIIIQKLETFSLNLLGEYPDVQQQIKNIFIKNTSSSDTVANVLNYLVNGAIGFVSKIISSIITFFTTTIFAIYMLSQKEYLQKGIKKVMYAYLKRERVEKILEISHLANQTFSRFISGQCVEAIILGAIFFVVLSIFRFPYALLISVLTSVTALIPIFGALIAMVVGAILIAVNNPLQAIVFVIVFQVIQQIEGNFIYPKVVGASVGLSPIWTLLAVTVGGSLFGLVGMLVGLPIASILYAILQNDVNKRIRFKRIS